MRWSSMDLFFDITARYLKIRINKELKKRYLTYKFIVNLCVLQLSRFLLNLLLKKSFKKEPETGTLQNVTLMKLLSVFRK